MAYDAVVRSKLTDGCCATRSLDRRQRKEHLHGFVSPALFAAEGTTSFHPPEGCDLPPHLREATTPMALGPGQGAGQAVAGTAPLARHGSDRSAAAPLAGLEAAFITEKAVFKVPLAWAGPPLRASVRVTKAVRQPNSPRRLELSFVVSASSPALARWAVDKVQELGMAPVGDYAEVTTN